MALIVFGSQKGSPGASLTALAVAGAWPQREGRRTVLLEADPDGGVMAMRYGLGREPGLLSLAASARHGVARGDLWAHTQEIPGGLAIIVAPDRPDQATAALNTAGATLGPWLAALPDVDVVADLGRLGPSSPALTLAAAADMVLMVARPTSEQLMPAAERVNTLRLHNPSTGWCLIGTKPHSPEEIEQVYEAPVVGVIADDPRGADALEHGGSPKRLRRSALVRSAAELAHQLDGWLHPGHESSAAEAEPEPVAPAPEPDPVPPAPTPESSSLDDPPPPPPSAPPAPPAPPSPPTASDTPQLSAAPRWADVEAAS